MARQETANTLINRAALEVGLTPVSDPVASQDPAFIQLTGLLTAAGQELVELRPWQVLLQEYAFTTVVPGDTGVYDLPDDFSSMVNQTGWDQTNSTMVFGPLSSQEWSYLDGRGLASETIYASFRLAENKMQLYPQPPPNGIDIRFEYISRYWVRSTGSSDPDKDTITIGTDIVLYEPILVVKFLKVKFLEAKGFDTTAARLDFETMFDSRAGRDAGAPTLRAGGVRNTFPYLTPFNTGDTNYGS